MKIIFQRVALAVAFDGNAEEGRPKRGDSQPGEVGDGGPLKLGVALKDEGCGGCTCVANKCKKANRKV